MAPMLDLELKTTHVGLTDAVPFAGFPGIYGRIFCDMATAAPSE